MGTSNVLALDLGGTVLKAAVVGSDGTVYSRHLTPSCEQQGLDAWSGAARRAARRALSASGVTAERIGLSLPGAVDANRAVLVDLVERIPEARDVDLRKLFSTMGLPLAADNDARAALRAERRWGRAMAAQSTVMLTVGTGLGGAALVDGRQPGGDPILSGNQLGHFVLEIDGAACVCGNRGCAETLASGSGLLRLAREHGLEADDAREIFESARAGNRIAIGAVDRFRAALIASVVNAIHAYQPELVLLAGGVMQAAAGMMPAIRRTVDERAWTIPRGRVRIELSSLGNDSGILGAAAVALTSGRD